MSEVVITGTIVRLRTIDGVNHIVQLFTKQGKITLYSVGSQKPGSKNKKYLVLGGEIFASAFLPLEKNKMGKLKKCFSVKPFLNDGYWPNFYHDWALNIVGHNNFHNSFYNVVKNFSSLFSGETTLAGWVWFLAQIINLNGYKPVVNHCVDCQKNTDIFAFEIEGGGLKCVNHAFSMKKHQNNAEIAQLVFLFSCPFSDFLKVCNVHLLFKNEKLLLEYINNHTGFWTLHKPNNINDKIN